MPDGVHNAHMLIPKNLWDETKRIAILEGMSVTDVVCQALAALIEKRKEEQEDG